MSNLIVRDESSFTGVLSGLSSSGGSVVHTIVGSGGQLKRSSVQSNTNVQLGRVQSLLDPISGSKVLENKQLWHLHRMCFIIKKKVMTQKTFLICLNDLYSFLSTVQSLLLHVVFLSKSLIVAECRIAVVCAYQGFIVILHGIEIHLLQRSLDVFYCKMRSAGSENWDNDLPYLSHLANYQY